MKTNELLSKLGKLTLIGIMIAGLIYIISAGFFSSGGIVIKKLLKGNEVANPSSYQRPKFPSTHVVQPFRIDSPTAEEEHRR